MASRWVNLQLRKNYGPGDKVAQMTTISLGIVLDLSMVDGVYKLQL